MSQTQLSGPLLITGANQDNPDNGTSLIANGAGLLDSRFSYPYGATGTLLAIGYLGFTHIPVIDQIPSTLSTVAIAGAQTPTPGTALTLTATSTLGITVLASPLVVMPSRTTIPTGTLVIDSSPSTVYVSQNGSTQLYNPSTAIARAITISCNANDSAGTYTVKGFDVYGYAMSEAITGASASGTVTGNKAFKFVSSITPSGTINSTSVSAGQSDKYGFPLRADTFGQVEIVWANAQVTAQTSGTFTYAVTTSPATSTTGDVRGTWLSSSASNGTNRLQIFMSPSVLNTLSQTGLWGVTQA